MMQLVVNTQKLKDMVSKSIKGAGNNKLIPITQFIGITKVDNTLRLTTTDATNYLYVQDTIDESEEEFAVTVFVEQFSKIISKLTSENVSLVVKDNVLEVHGNGTYSIELPLDENGEIIKFPDPIANIKKADSKGSVSLADIKVILDSVKPSLSTDTNSDIVNYFIGDTALATDSYKIASFNKKLLDGEYLIAPELLDLFSVVSTDKINYKIVGDSIVFEAGDVTIYGKLMNEEYPVDVLEKLLSEKFPSVCKINKQDFLNLLDRISIFVSKYDDKAIRLYFEKDGITVSNKNRSSNEKIEYKDSKKHKDFDCVIDVEFLTTQIKAYASDVIEMHYGKENSIKLVDGNITQIVALNEK